MFALSLWPDISMEIQKSRSSSWYRNINYYVEVKRKFVWIVTIYFMPSNIYMSKTSYKEKINTLHMKCIDTSILLQNGKWIFLIILEEKIQKLPKRQERHPYKQSKGATQLSHEWYGWVHPSFLLDFYVSAGKVEAYGKCPEIEILFNL